MSSAQPKKAASKPFTMVRRSLWRSKRFGGLPNDAARYLYLYLLTCQHQGPIGCMRLDDSYALSDLNLTGAKWSLAKYQAAKAAVIESGLALFDADTGEMLLTGWWKDNGPSNDSWFVGARKRCDGIEAATLKAHALADLDECWEAFQIARGLPARSATCAPTSLNGGGGISDALRRSHLTRTGEAR